MKYKKLLIFLLAILIITAALYGIWRQQKNITNEPVRQEQEIR